MNLRSDHELAVTERKLRILEAQHRRAAQEPNDHPHLQELTLRSLKRTINQFIEEITRYRIQTKQNGVPIYGMPTGVRDAAAQGAVIRSETEGAEA